ncbi:MAG: haloacid dehalogenase superfamily protein, subfamily IA, variant 3 with third motif having DD or ED [Parcubacteria group bacterium Gr01-1014_3]|nr:MAG: haloacid dehalogenase superfamily protein, subfamily IA, variant 3 with third motif having DD or ED [Parcubacteria group bacterium Gr01-1014_3]
MIKAVIFDLDGTLLDSERVNIGAAVKTFQELGHPLSREDQSWLAGRSSKDFIPVFLKKFGLSGDLFDSLFVKNHENYLELWDTDLAQLMPGVIGVLHFLLKQKKILSMATNNSWPIVERFLTRFCLKNVFTHITVGDDVEHRKPHPEIYMTAHKKLRLSAIEIIAVEDLATGLISAKEAGLPCAVVPTEWSKDQDFSRADYILSSLQELLSIVA